MQEVQRATLDFKKTEKVFIHNTSRSSFNLFLIKLNPSIVLLVSHPLQRSSSEVNPRTADDDATSVTIIGFCSYSLPICA